MKELIEVQGLLKAPKGQKNTFGNYSYRSCEDILQAVKPLCIERGLLLTISDELVMIGDRYYIKATVSITKDQNSVTTTAYARETLSKKGMDDSQLTGSTSSYARKYALNGMFCIDDTKDADTMDNRQQPKAWSLPKEWNDHFQKNLALIKDNNVIISLTERWDFCKTEQDYIAVGKEAKA